MTASKAQQAFVAARKRALCAYVGKPPTYDVDANAVEVLKIIDREYRTREWRAPDGADVSIKKRGDGICFRSSKKTADPPTHGDGTAPEIKDPQDNSWRSVNVFRDAIDMETAFVAYIGSLECEINLKLCLPENYRSDFYGSNAYAQGTRACGITIRQP